MDLRLAKPHETVVGTVACESYRGTTDLGTPVARDYRQRNTIEHKVLRMSRDETLRKHKRFKSNYVYWRTGENKKDVCTISGKIYPQKKSERNLSLHARLISEDLPLCRVSPQ